MDRTFKKTYVCFDCMETSRRSYTDSKSIINCSKCNGNMIGLSTKMRVPKKKRKEWDNFKEWVSNYNSYFKMLIENQ